MLSQSTSRYGNSRYSWRGDDQDQYRQNSYGTPNGQVPIIVEVKNIAEEASKQLIHQLIKQRSKLLASK